jgi:long-chain fatty acid transport protein
MKRRLALAIRCALAASALLASSECAFAITDLESNAAIPFSFSNPGARSLGMGGAFVGLADDATAAYTNPAGLTQLVQTEVSIEGRRVETNSPYTSGGSAALPYELSGVNFGNVKNTNSSPSFMAVVLPHGDWAFAFYRHELAKFNTNVDEAGGTLLPGSLELTPYTAHADLHIVNYSFAMALKANDMISVGVGVSYYDFDFAAQRNETLLSTSSRNNATDDGSDHALAATLGLRLRFNDQWSAGFAYRVSPKFNFNERIQGFLPDKFGNYTIVDPTDIINSREQFKVPDVISAGLTYHVSEQLLLNFDVDRVYYSQLTGKLTSNFGIPNSTLDQLNISNGTEVHLGGEYTFASMEHPISLRAGVWHDPRHTIQFEGTPANLNDLVEAVAFGGGYGAKTHYSLGAGMAFKQFQLDAAYDGSDKVKTASVSAVYRF